MTPTGAELLARLGSGVRPDGVARGDHGPRPAAPSGVPSASFARLLEAAGRGGSGSGLAVEIDPSLGLELSPEQMGRLGAAADRAAGEGARRAVVLLDGRALVIDVEARRVTEAHAIGAVSALTGIDAVVGAPGAEGGERPAGLGGLTNRAAGVLARTAAKHDGADQHS